MPSVGDGFDRADANPISGDWEAQGGLAPCQIVSNRVRPTATGGGGNHALYGLLSTNQQTSRLKVITLNAGAQARALCRGRSGSLDCYFTISGGPFGPVAGVTLAKYVAGNYQEIGTGNTAALASGDTIACDCNATTTIRSLVNGSEIYSVTDSSLASGKMGVGAFATVAVSDVEIDDWIGTTPSGAVKRSRFLNFFPA